MLYEAKRDNKSQTFINYRQNVGLSDLQVCVIEQDGLYLAVDREGKLLPGVRSIDSLFRSGGNGMPSYEIIRMSVDVVMIKGKASVPVKQKRPGYLAALFNRIFKRACNGF